jgi:Zn-dependent M28 family amino/carboxypeptidase
MFWARLEGRTALHGDAMRKAPLRRAPCLIIDQMRRWSREAVRAAGRADADFGMSAMSKIRIGAAPFLIAAALATQASAAPPPDRHPAQRWWGHMATLSDDSLQGRAPGASGYSAAVDYVTKRFEAYGLAPWTAGGYLQSVGLIEQRVIAERSSVAVFDGSKDTVLTLGVDLLLGSRFIQPQTIEAPLIFIGYGLHVPRFGHDDFAGQDLRGKILVAINGGPQSLTGPVKSGARAAETWRAIERTGALGLITLPTPRSMDIPWERQALLARNPGMMLGDTVLQEAKAPRFTATLNPARADAVFARSGHTYAELAAIADRGGAMPGFPLNLTLKATVAAETRRLESPNVAGMIRGADPAVADEYVVVSAHLDHLGVGAPIGGDAIYNGAMDDASGTATVLELAERFARGGDRPKRSIVFALFTAEEKGLLGSRAFAEGARAAGRRIVADVNMDMPLPLWPLTSLYMPGAEESTLGREAALVAAAQGYRIVPDPYPDRNVFTRTDQFSFVRAGFPAVAVKFGFAADTPEAQIERTWRAERYHSPSDDMDQPMDLDAAAKFNTFVEAFARHLADLPAPPRWEPTSLFAPAP